MKPKNYEVLMDIYMGVLNAPAIQFTTEDFGMCQITFSLLEDRITPYNLSNCIVRMVINGQQQDCTISDANNGKAEIVLLQSMFTEVGHVFAELQIYDATNQTMRLTTPTFKYTVRKSLMDDNTVQADANYSILQQMILNVSNADKVSSEALKLSKEAKAICDDLVPKANTAAQNAQTALDRAESVVTQEELAQKVMLGGAPQTKLDFIESKVAQDGLIDSQLDITLKTSKKLEQINILNDNFTLMGIVKKNENANIVYVPYVTSLRIEWASVSKLWMSRLGTKVILQNTEFNQYVPFVYSKESDIVTIQVGDKKASVSINEMPSEDLGKWGFGDSSNLWIGAANKSTTLGYVFYNRVLTDKEIQHNFQVLGNLSSINSVSVTVKDGTNKSFSFSTKSNQTTMSSGFNLEQSYTGLLKAMGEEFVSVDGSPIIINNGVEYGKIIEGEIQGRTIKNYLYNKTNFEFDRDKNLDYRIKNTTLEDRKIKFKANKIYVVKFYVSKVDFGTSTRKTLGVSIRSSNNTVQYQLSSELKLGLNSLNLSSTLDFTIESFYIAAEQLEGNMKLTVDYIVIVDQENSSYVNSYIPFGLQRTNSIITNNFKSNPLCTNNIQIGGSGGVNDILKLNIDGSRTLIKSKSSIILDGSQNYSWYLTSFDNDTSKIYVRTNSLDSMIKTGSTFLSDKMEYTADSIYSNMSKDSIPPSKTIAKAFDTVKIRFVLDVGELTELTDTALNNYLKANPIELEFDIEALEVTHIDKEQSNSIPTDKTNILEAGGKVKASSFKVTVPVDKLAEIEARLQALESTTVDVVLNK